MTTKEQKVSTNMTVHCYDVERGTVLSTERSVCEVCGEAGWVGDWPGEGGLVVDTRGRLICDECAAEEDA
jgi:hypothetical protein